MANEEQVQQVMRISKGNHCRQDLAKFASAVLSKDQDMLSTIIKERG